MYEGRKATDEDRKLFEQWFKEPEGPATDKIYRDSIDHRFFYSKCLTVPGMTKFKEVHCDIEDLAHQLSTACMVKYKYLTYPEASRYLRLFIAECANRDLSALPIPQLMDSKWINKYIQVASICIRNRQLAKEFFA